MRSVNDTTERTSTHTHTLTRGSVMCTLRACLCIRDKNKQTPTPSTTSVYFQRNTNTKDMNGPHSASCDDSAERGKMSLHCRKRSREVKSNRPPTKSRLKCDANERDETMCRTAHCFAGRDDACVHRATPYAADCFMRKRFGRFRSVFLFTAFVSVGLVGSLDVCHELRLSSQPIH